MIWYIWYSWYIWYAGTSGTYDYISMVWYSFMVQLVHMIQLVHMVQLVHKVHKVAHNFHNSQLTSYTSVRQLATFSSVNFKNFMSPNGMLHRRVLPFHPFSNGLGEKVVRFLKQALNKAHRSDRIESKLQNVWLLIELLLTQLLEEHQGSCYLTGWLG